MFPARKAVPSHGRGLRAAVQSHGPHDSHAASRARPVPIHRGASGLARAGQRPSSQLLQKLLQHVW